MRLSFIEACLSTCGFVFHCLKEGPLSLFSGRLAAFGAREVLSRTQVPQGRL